MGASNVSGTVAPFGLGTNGLGSGSSLLTDLLPEVGTVGNETFGLMLPFASFGITGLQDVEVNLFEDQAAVETVAGRVRAFVLVAVSVVFVLLFVRLVRQLHS